MLENKFLVYIFDVVVTLYSYVFWYIDFEYDVDKWRKINLNCGN